MSRASHMTLPNCSGAGNVAKLIKYLASVIVFARVFPCAHKSHPCTFLTCRTQSTLPQRKTTQMSLQLLHPAHFQDPWVLTVVVPWDLHVASLGVRIPPHHHTASVLFCERRQGNSNKLSHSERGRM